MAFGALVAYILHMSRKPATKRGRQTATSNKLTALEERFCQEFVVDFKAAEALRRAGSKAQYLDQQASEMRQRPRVAARILMLSASHAEKCAVDKSWVMAEHVRVYRMAMLEASQGGPRLASLLTVALRSLEKLGMHVDVNAFRQQLGLGNPDGSNFDLSGLNDAELDRLETLLAKAALTSGDPGGEGETVQ